MYEIDQAQIHFDEVLYAKGCTKIYTYGKEDDHKVVKRKSCANKNVKEKFVQEFTLGGFRDDENIVNIEAYLVKATQIPKGGYNVYFLMPRMEGNLSELLSRYKKKGQHIPFNRLVQYFYDLASGVRSLHLARIAHRNIKLSNILFDKQNKLKLSDFSSAVSLDDSNEMKEKDYYCKQDIWGLGIVFLEMCLLDRLELDPNELETTIEKNLLWVKKMYNETISNLLKGMLAIDPSKRKNAKEIYDEIKKIKAELKEENSPPDYFDQADKENVNILNENLIARQEEAQKKVSTSKTTKFYSQKNLIKNDILEPRIDITENETIPVATLDVLKEKRMKSNSPPPSNQVKKTSIFRKFSLVNYKTPEKSEDLHTKKFSLSNYTRLSSEISEIQKQYQDCFEIELERPSWQTLTLNILNADDHCDLNDETMEVFLQAITSCLKTCDMDDFLSKATLELNHCLKLTNNFLEVLGNSISQSFENLSSLSLSFSKPLSKSESSLQFTDEGLIKLAKKIGSHLRLLQSLALEFSSCSQITKKGVMEFADLFKIYFKHLKELNLSFSLCRGVGDNGFCYLGNIIHENQTHLQKLTLRGYMTGETKEKLENRFGKIIGFN